MKNEPSQLTRLQLKLDCLQCALIFLNISWNITMKSHLASNANAKLCYHLVFIVLHQRNRPGFHAQLSTKNAKLFYRVHYCMFLILCKYSHVSIFSCPLFTISFLMFLFPCILNFSMIFFTAEGRHYQMMQQNCLTVMWTGQRCNSTMQILPRKTCH